MEQAVERRRLEQEAIDKPLAEVLPVPLDLKVNDSFTIRERLHRIGAHAVDSRNVVDREGNVIYTRPEGFDLSQGLAGARELLTILKALDTYSPTTDFTEDGKRRWTVGNGQFGSMTMTVTAN
jgi:hypothetical protein